MDPAMDVVDQPTQQPADYLEVLTNSDLVTLLNDSVQYCKIVNMKELELQQLYEVKQFDRCNNKYGDCIVATIIIKDVRCKVYLPNRYLKQMTNERCVQYNTSTEPRMKMAYLGQANKSYQLRFEI